MERPVYDMLSAASYRTGFHMPGHKGHAPFGNLDLFALDTTELPITDDLYCPENGLAHAQELYARAVGAAATVFLHNGSSMGIHVMLQLYAREGDTVLLPRNAHHSAGHACVIGGLKVIWMPVSVTEDGYCYVQEDTVLRTLHEHPEAKAVLLTCPDYYGGVMPMSKILQEAKQLNIRVLVDSAHGAHFPWLEEMEAAEKPDAWVQSVHKTLPGLTGSAVLHLAERQDLNRAMLLLRRQQTSSPSFLLCLSIDDARAYMESEGKARLSALVEKVRQVKAQLPETAFRDAYAMWTMTGQSFDPTRLVLYTPGNGHELQSQLAARGIDVEMADEHRVVLILTCMDELSKLDELLAVLKELPLQKAVVGRCSYQIDLPEAVMTLRQAAMTEEETVPLNQAAGRISAVSAGLYPPGIPMVVPGERITEEIAEVLEKAGERERFGTEGALIRCVR